jgi:hypothetical protein
MFELIFVPFGYLIQRYIIEYLFPDRTLIQSLYDELIVFLIVLSIGLIFTINIMTLIMLTIGAVIRILQKDLND